MIKPKRLHIGDTVAIVSLSKGMLGEDLFIHKYYIAKQRLENMGFKVLVMPNALKGIDYLYNHPEKRAEDLMTAFKNNEIKAIFNAIGGDDTIRILPYIDFSIIENNPKIFTGFSDTTINHFMMHKANLVSYYGLSVMNNIAEYIKINDYTNYFIENMLINPKNKLEIPCSSLCSFEDDKIWWMEENMNKETPTYPNKPYEILQGKGIVDGYLLGGCIDSFVELIGTPLWPSLEDWRDKLLLIETSEENMSSTYLTWLLRNLAAQGLFKVIKGIVVGKPCYIDKYEEYKKVYHQVIALEEGLQDLPILYNVNVGHAYPIGIFPLGLKYRIDCNHKTFYLMESATN